MTKNLGKIAELRTALNALYIWQKSINLAVEAARKELLDLEKE